MTLGPSALHSVIVANCVLCAGCIWYSRRGHPLWLLDPRGPFAVALCLAAAGIPIFKSITGDFPILFGLDVSLLPLAAVCLTAGNVAFASGSLIGAKLPVSPAPRQFHTQALIRGLTWAIIASGLARYAGLAYTGFGAVLSQRRGTGQWDRVTLPLENVWFIAMPSFMALLMVLAMRRKSVISVRTTTLGVYVLAPSVLLGGRKDLLFGVLALGTALAIKSGKTRLRSLILLAVLGASLTYFQSTTRSGDSLTLGSRSNALREATKTNASGLSAFFANAIPIANVLTAAMTVFPERESFAFGMSYIGSAANLAVPHFIVGSYAADPPNIAFRRLYYPDVDDFGLDYALAAEAYQNFGVIGVPLIMFLVGLLLESTFQRATLHPCSRWPVIHLILASAFLWGIRTDSNATFKAALYGIVWIFMVERVMILLQPRRSPLVDRSLAHISHPMDGTPRSTLPVIRLR